jgi:hypothetical protein
MQREIKVGTVSWINDTPNPMYSSLQIQTLSPEWLTKTYLGLSATSNPVPPDPLTDLPGYQKGKDFRAMTFCHFRVDIDDSTGRLSAFRVLNAFHDPGWTPAFKARNWPSPLLSFSKSIWSFTWYQGEYSSLSVVATEGRHPNAVISNVPPTETVLVDALIKFRAGKHTDDVGINEVGCPFHVPWVWSELVLTYGSGKFKIYGQGSVFPSHAWYFNDKCVKTIGQASDGSFPVTRAGALPQVQIQRLPGAHLRALPVPATIIAVNQLKIYPVLSAGAPSWGPQQPLADESTRTGPVDQHPYTASGGDAWSQLL